MFFDLLNVGHVSTSSDHRNGDAFLSESEILKKERGSVVRFCSHSVMASFSRYLEEVPTPT